VFAGRAASAETTAAPEATVLIVLVDNQGSRELVARVEAELSALGFRVRRLSRRGNEALPRLARRAAAVAAVGVRRRDVAIDLWGEDPDSGHTAFADRIAVDPARGKEIAAVAAAEALRGRLLRLGVTAQTLQSEVAKAPPAAEPEPAPLETRGVRYGAFFALGPGSGLSSVPSAFMRVGGEIAPLSWLSLSLAGAWQPLPDELSAREGEASVRVAQALLSADYRFGSDALRWGAGPGFALALVDMEGSAGGDYRARSERLVTSGPFAHGMAALRLVGPLHLRADAELGVALPRIVVRFAGRDVASWGRPFLQCALGLELFF
jgi:hypothetical protein